MFRQIVALALTGVVLASCMPTGQRLPTPGAALVSSTKTTSVLADLPPPSEALDVAVYEFPDLTGQAKPNPSFAEYSRAVTQGAASILVDVLTTAGDGTWFKVAERTGLKNLVQERTLIENTRRAYTGEGALPPVRFASYIIEGGIVGYDSDELTGGAGAKYFGIGGDVMYRSDVVTINLRIISVNNGAVVMSTTTTKQIYSYEARAGVFIFASPERLLEIEGGFSLNDPGQLAVREAIELAVYTTVVKGVEQGLWHLKDRSLEAGLVGGYQDDYVEPSQKTKRLFGIY